MISCAVFLGLLSLHISMLCTPPSSSLSLPWCTYMYKSLLVLRDPEWEHVSVPGSARNDPARKPMQLSSRNMAGRCALCLQGPGGHSAFVWHCLFLASLVDAPHRNEKMKEAHFEPEPAQQLIQCSLFFPGCSNLGTWGLLEECGGVMGSIVPDSLIMFA